MLYDLSFGTWLKQRRRTLDLTQADLAGDVGCSVDTIYRFESGARRPSKQVALRLAAILNIEDADRDTFLRLARAPAQVEDVDDDPLILPPTQVHHPYLPNPTTPLIERADDVAHICAQLRRPNVRLITIVGLAGVGKTRLSLQVAHEVVDTFSDGVFFVALDTVTDPLLIGRAIARAVGVGEQGTESTDESLLAHLRDRDVLLVLDNFEHLLEGAGLVADVLAACPSLKVLVTSRERLHLWSEWIWDLDGLSFPPDDAVSDLQSYGAVQLFEQRAQQVSRHWRLDLGNVHSVTRICRLVEGLPLAIELAASAVRGRDCASIADDIAARGPALAVVAHDLPVRHRSVWASLEHSWHLLKEEEQRVLPMLAVFRGGWTEEAAGVVALASPSVLQSLVEHSLVRHAVHVDGTHRYSFHAVIRQYAEDKCAGREEFTDATRRHLAYFQALAAESQHGLTGPQQTAWIDRLEREHDNMRAALRWASEHGKADDALALAASLTQFWFQRGYWQEGRAWLASITASSDATRSTQAYARALWSMATLARCQNDYDVAMHEYAICLDLFEQLGDLLYVGKTLQGMAEAVMNRRDFERGVALYERSLTILPQEHDLEIGHALGGIGGAWLMQGDVERAAPFFDASLLHFRRLGDKGAIASTLTFASAVARQRGDFTAARALGEEALELCRELGHKIGTSWALHTIGMIDLETGDLDHAERLFTESLMLRWGLRDKQGVAWALEGLAEIASARRLPHRAARLWGKAVALREDMGANLTCTEREELEARMAPARRSVDVREWNVAWQQGQRMPIEDAVAYGLSGRTHV